MDLLRGKATIPSFWGHKLNRLGFWGRLSPYRQFNAKLYFYFAPKLQENLLTAILNVSPKRQLWSWVIVLWPQNEGIVVVPHAGPGRKAGGDVPCVCGAPAQQIFEIACRAEWGNHGIGILIHIRVVDIARIQYIIQLPCLNGRLWSGNVSLTGFYEI